MAYSVTSEQSMGTRPQRTARAAFRGQKPSQDRDYRDRLVREHMWLVHTIARNMKARLHSSVSLDDLIADGYEGLVKAAGNYDPSVNDTFKKYAEFRIRGAILDGIRRDDPISRGDRALSRGIHNAELRLSERGPVSDELIAAELKIPVEDVSELRVLPAFCSLFAKDGGLASVAAKAFSEGPSPAQDAEDASTARLIDEVLAGMPRRLSTVLRLHFLEELKQPEIAAQLNISPGMVSQRISKALRIFKCRYLAAMRSRQAQIRVQEEPAEEPEAQPRTKTKECVLFARPLKEGEREQLDSYLQGENPKESRRAQIVLLSVQRFSVPLIAEMVGVNPPMATGVVRGFNLFGVGYIKVMAGAGRRGFSVTPELRDEISRTFACSPSEFGLDLARWTPPMLGGYLRSQGVVVSDWIVDKVLKEAANPSASTALQGSP